jgi:pimeloyl-ACP methyl ester carboxylesterase
MATFGLVHGGFHGAWCWERVMPLLTTRGHSAVAMDLPSDDPDATLSDYVAAVVDALVAVDEPVILVGHSMGGLVVPHVARLRPVARLVFICAMFDNLPEPASGVEVPDVTRSEFDMSSLTIDDRVTTIAPERAVAAFYADCDPADADWAVARLRPQSHAPATPLVAPWPEVPSTVITCTDDRSRDFTRLIVAPRLGVEPIELPGGHSPFLSRPNALADVLLGIADADSVAHRDDVAGGLAP